MEASVIYDIFKNNLLWKMILKNNVNYTITNWRVSLSKICHEWPNNAVTHECAQRMSELQCYLVMSNIFLIMKLFGHEWHIFDNKTRQLVIVFII